MNQLGFINASAVETGLLRGYMPAATGLRFVLKGVSGCIHLAYLVFLCSEKMGTMGIGVDLFVGCG